jgi:hypothetical protein
MGGHNRFQLSREVCALTAQHIAKGLSPQDMLAVATIAAAGSFGQL